MRAEVRFRAYSIKNPDAKYVLAEDRFRGCSVGDPCIVWGQSIEQSERRLRELIEKFKQEGLTILNRKKGSFSILCDVDVAKKIKGGFIK